MEPSIRTAVPADAYALTRLSAQLGYPVSEQETRNNLACILGKSNETILVAVLNEEVVGWIGLTAIVHLCDGAYCQINGLVVDNNCYRKGVGRKMLDAARRWALSQDRRQLKVHCNTRRKEAHLFYTGIGFTEIKEQKVFKMNID